MKDHVVSRARWRRAVSSFILFMFGAFLILGICGCAHYASGKWAREHPDDIGIELIFHVHSEKLTQIFINDQVFHANRTLKHHGIRITRVHIVEDIGPWLNFPMSESFGGHSRLLTDVTNHDRRGLHVYVVNEIDPHKNIVGASMRDEIQVCKRAIALQFDDDILGPHTHPTTLAHEIGHTFGLKHASNDTNVMMPGGRYKYSTFTRSQHETMKRHAHEWKLRCVS